MTGQEQRIKISELPSSVSFRGLWTLGYQNIDGKKTSVKVSLDEIQAAYENAVAAAGTANTAAGNAASAAGRAVKAAEEAEKINITVSASENKRIEAETARADAEQERARVEALRQEAEELRKVNEAERFCSEASRKEAEDARAIAEGLRAGEEAKRASAELLRIQIEQARASEETKRAEAEKARAASESLRDQSEKQRREAETLRDRAEQERALEEAGRDTAEQERIAKETERSASELQRISAETLRSEKEAERIVEEQLRIHAETARQDNEATRQTQEELREQNTLQAILNAEAATEKATESTALMGELSAHPMKPQAGLWYRWNPETDQYENTGIQAKGDPGQSFRIIGQYDTIEALKAAVPDGTGIDGVYAVGSADPYNYYAWIYKDGAWQWVDQGQLRGAEGKSAYEVWMENPDHAGKTEADYFNYLRQPATDAADETREAIKDAQTATANANEATTKANTAATNAEEATKKANTAAGNAVTATGEASKATEAAQEATGIAIAAAQVANNASASLIIPDIDHEPGEDDLSYVYNDITYQYKIGGLCRMADPDTEEGYTFFRLYDITEDGKAVWGGAGSGNGSSANQTAARLIIDTSMQTGQVNVSNIAGFYLLAEKIRRCMGALGADGGMKACPLDNGNSTLAARYGLPMATDGTDGDMFVMLPDVWYKREKLSDTQQSFLVTGDKPSGKGWIHLTSSLVGAKKGYIQNGKLRSISGVVPTTDLPYDDFLAAAKACGEDYGLISYGQHCVIALLLYIKYKTFYLQGKVGLSKASYDANNLTGSSDLSGMNDTTAGSVTGYVNALGVEGVYGGFYEFMQGLTLTGTTWHIEEADGTVRHVEAPNLSTGWISHTALEEGDRFDLLPTACTGTSSTFYTDYCEVAQSKYIPLVAARSCFTGSDPETSFPDDGVAYINATHKKEEPGKFYGSRLAYFGEVEVVDDPNIYREMINT